jgi:thioredoxin-like negative regulator of GroEL
MKPIFNKFVESQGDKITSEIVNADENQELLQKYNVGNIPTVIFEQDGELVEKVVGVISLIKLEEIVAKYESKN